MLNTCIVWLRCSVFAWCVVEICAKGHSNKRGKNSPPSAATLLSHAGQTLMGSKQCIQTGQSVLLGRTQTWCGPFFAPSWWLWQPVLGKHCPGSSLPSVSVGNKAKIHTYCNGGVSIQVLHKCSYNKYKKLSLFSFALSLVQIWDVIFLYCSESY